jgi:hypothetical protein
MNAGLKGCPIGRAALDYFALVFLAGFFLGAVRILLIAPRWGEMPATLMELPVMLFVSWQACGTVLREFDIRGRRAAIAMGAIALAMLIGAELTLSVLMYGRPPGAFFRSYATLLGGIGLLGQISFGLFPLVRGMVSSSR